MFFLLFFFIWVLQPFQEYFTYIEPVIHQMWVKTREHRENYKQNLAFPQVNWARLKTTAVRNLMD